MRAMVIDNYKAPWLSGSMRAPLLQRKCACGSHTIGGGECESCQQEENPNNLQRVATDSGSFEEVPEIVHEVLRSSGQPLDATTRSFFEPRFGHDFSQVRVHTDAKAAASARAVNALAYTVGRDVVFGAGRYRPGGNEGQHLLAHELTHVVQQRFERSATSVQIPSNNGDHETEASKTADLFVANTSHIQTPTRTTNTMLARQASDEVPSIERSFELDPKMFVKPMDAPAEREKEKGPFSCPKGFKDLGAFRLTAYVLAQESEFPETPRVPNPCGLKGTFRRAFLFETTHPPLGVKMQGSGRSLNGDIIHWAGDDCFEVLDCPKTKSGTCATSGRTVAVDKSVIKLGSELIIEDAGERVAEDTGSMINGHHIDIYHGTDISMSEALKRTMTKKKVCRKLVK
jgi:hypothetical protein